MARDPLDSWRKMLAKDRVRAAMLPQGEVKNALNKKLREIEMIVQVVEALPEADPFRSRVKNVARLMQETPTTDLEARKLVTDEFAGCLKIVRSVRRAAFNAKLATKGE
jgi:hypothetical protein